jgi:hypothetical protein
VSAAGSFSCLQIDPLLPGGVAAGLPPLPLFAENFRFSPFFPLFFRCSAFFRFFVFYAFLYKQLYFPIENSA